MAIWRDQFSMQNDAISLVAMCSKEFWLVKGSHTTVKLESSRRCVSWNRKLTAKLTLNCEIYKSNTNNGKVMPVFVIKAPLSAEKLGRCLEYWWSWKIRSQQLVLQSTLKGIWFEFWMKGALTALMTVEIFVFCGWWFPDQFDIVSETFSNCDSVGPEL